MTIKQIQDSIAHAQEQIASAKQLRDTSIMPANLITMLNEEIYEYEISIIELSHQAAQLRFSDRVEKSA
ncbi:MAG: hypothetical protein AAFQ07_15675, partial [Chloroflexota bacterium]